MPNSGDQYSDTARQIVKEAREERSSYVARCKTMTAEQFLAEPVERRRRLTPEEQIEIAMAIAGRKQVLPAGGVPATTARAVPSKSALSSPRRFWTKDSDTRKALIVAIASSVLMSPVFPLLTAAGLVHPGVWNRPGVDLSNGETWPKCNRLDPRVNRCVYETTAAHDWPHIAALLGQEVDTLRRNNMHIAGDYVPADALIIVSRSANR